MNDVFHTDDGVLVANLSGFVTRTEARAAGFRWVAALLTHDPAAAGNETEIRERGAAYRAEGWRLCGWGTYGQAATPEEDGKEAARLCVALLLDGWVADGEDWAEGTNRDYTQRFIRAYRAAGAPSPLAFAPLSSETSNYARDFDYSACLQAGAMVMPQVYGNDIPTLTVNACLGSLAKAGVPLTSVSMMFGTYTEPIPVADYQGWSGPRAVYVGDRTPAAAWSTLARSAARPGTPPGGGTSVTPPPTLKTSLTAEQVPDTTPYARAGNPAGLRSQGPTAEALKRALSRAGAPSLPWRDFDQAYNTDLEAAWDWYDARVGAGPADGYGAGRLARVRRMMADPAGAAAGQPALDTYAMTLIQNEVGATSDSGKLAVFQKALTAAVTVALGAGSRWRYNEKIRPVALNINVASPPGTSDCSGSVIQLVDRARRDAKLTTAIQDPAKQNWSGYGNTDEHEDDWPKVGGPYRVGDLAHFGNPRHVAICYQPGTRVTARWWSFGHEPPQSVELDTYRTNDFLFVVRPAYIG